MLRLKITTENGESTLFVEDSPFSESIPISEEPDNQIVDLLDGLYVPLPYRTPVVQVEGSSQEAVISQDAVTRELELVRTTKVEKMAGYSLVSDEEQDRLAGVEDGATKNSSDADLRARGSHTGEQPTSTITGLDAEINAINSSLQTKVDKVVGKELSDNNFSTQEKDKLASLESSRFKGVFTSLESLTSGVVSPSAGDYAQVDKGVGQEAVVYIYDATDANWFEQKSATTLTSSQVKQLYESNANTEALTTALKVKLESVDTGATLNSTDAQLRDRALHTGTQPISSVTGLSTELGNRVTIQDSRLTDAREWVAATVSEPIAIAGEDTRRWAWTAQRIKQLVLGWWAGTLAQTSGDSTNKVMSQNATKTYMEDNLGDIQTILDEINRGSL